MAATARGVKFLKDNTRTFDSNPDHCSCYDLLFNLPAVHVTKTGNRNSKIIPEKFLRSNTVIQGACNALFCLIGVMVILDLRRNLGSVYLALQI